MQSGRDTLVATISGSIVSAIRLCGEALLSIGTSPRWRPDARIQIRCPSSVPSDAMSDQPAAHERGRSYRATVSTGVVAGLLIVGLLGVAWFVRDRIEPESAESKSSPDVDPQTRFTQLVQLVIERGDDTISVEDFVVDDGMLEQLRGLAGIETLILDRGIVTDQGIEAICSLPDLRYLRLRQSPISDAGLRQLAASRTLWYLNLPQATCTAEGVTSLATAANLQHLRLGSAGLGEDAAAAIAKLRSLRGLHLIGVPIDDQGIKLIATLPELRTLYLDDAAVTDVGWSWLFAEQPNIHVHVNQHHLDRDPQAH